MCEAMTSAHLRLHKKIQNIRRSREKKVDCTYLQIRGVQFIVTLSVIVFCDFAVFKFSTGLICPNKTEFDSTINNFIYEHTYKLPNDSKLKIFEKSQNWNWT